MSLLGVNVKAAAANGRLQVAQIGVGNRGKVNLNSLLRLADVDVVAMCDVDSRFLGEAAQLNSEAALFSDYRKLFDAVGDKIDAVLVSTPDHMHAPIAMEAMKRGKHVYCEKPLAHNVGENRRLKELAAETGVVTQLGIQNSAGIGYRMTSEYIRSGLIGKISEVHVWSNKVWGRDDSVGPNRSDQVPDTLDWDLWLGVAPKRPYLKDAYHPLNWRKLLDFGTGTLGDMGVHIFDTPYRTLELTAPKWVKTSCRKPNGFSHPTRNIVEYGFDATPYTTSSLKWVWYDGEAAPPSSIPGVSIHDGVSLPDQGCILVGENGSLMTPHKSGPRTFPMDLIRSAPRPKIKPRNHHDEWVRACLGKGKTNSPFAYGGPLCEALQLGVVAGRFPGERLEWNPNTMTIANLPEANQYLNREYREF